MPETLSAAPEISPPDFDASGRRFAALARRPLYVLAVLTAVFWIVVLIILIINVESLTSGTAGDGVILDVGLFHLAVIVLYFWAAFRLRLGSRRVQRTGFLNQLPGGGAAFLARHRRRMLLCGALILFNVFVCVFSVLVLSDIGGGAWLEYPTLVVVAVATGLGDAIWLLGAPFFLAGPWLAVEKLRRTHPAAAADR